MSRRKAPDRLQAARPDRLLKTAQFPLQAPAPGQDLPLAVSGLQRPWQTEPARRRTKQRAEARWSGWRSRAIWCHIVDSASIRQQGGPAAVRHAIGCPYVRSIPRSRTNPQVNADILPGSLAEAGMTYRHLRTLGGRRHRSQDQTPSPNTLWRNESFRNYADYAASEAFRAGLDELEALARRQCCAVMCAEVLWWRCHRRIIADYLLVEGISVAHIMGHNQVLPATLTPGARLLPGGSLVYAIEQA